MLYTSERNYGCRFMEVTLFGLRTIILENEKIRVMFLLDKGTEIIEFNYKETDTDFLWRSPQGLSCLKSIHLTARDQQLPMDFYTGGWFEAFPNVGDACEYRNAKLPFYGEVMYLPWEYSVVRDDPEEVSLKCRVRTLRTPFLLEKTFTVKTNISSLFIEEQITNLGSETLAYQWGHHPNFGAPFLDGNCVIDMPEGEINVLGQNSRAESGDSGVWPFVDRRDGRKVDFRKMPAAHSGIRDLLFISNMKQAWAAVRNTKKGIGIGLSWDLEMFPNSVIWIVANGDSGYPRYGNTYVLCVLPKTCQIHSLAKEAEEAAPKEIKAGESKSFWLTATAFRDEGEVTDIERDGTMTFKD